MNAFCKRYSLISLIKKSKCYKTPGHPRCIEFILTNSPDLSNFHRMIVTVLKSTFQSLPPEIRNYRDYSKFDNAIFQTCLVNDLPK